MYQIQPSAWSCLSTAFALALGLNAETVHQLLGHDGSAIIHPDLEEPSRRRGFHIQELVDLCEKNGLAVVQFDAIPVACVQGTNREHVTYTHDQAQARFLKVLGKYTGVLTGKNPSGRPHALYWNGYTIIDPALGTPQNIERYTLDTFYAILSARDLR